jgi:CYTH domain-containing protein
MAEPLEYAVVERERRFLVQEIPAGVTRTMVIEDHYLLRTRLRLRQTTAEDGTRERKLGHKVRLDQGAAVIAHTSLYLDDDEWELLRSLPARSLRKTRHLLVRDGVVVAIDELHDGTLLAEIDDGEGAPAPPPAWLVVIEDVTDDESWTGVALAR